MLFTKLMLFKKIDIGLTLGLLLIISFHSYCSCTALYQNIERTVDQVGRVNDSFLAIANHILEKLVLKKTPRKSVLGK